MLSSCLVMYYSKIYVMDVCRYIYLLNHNHILDFICYESWFSLLSRTEAGCIARASNISAEMISFITILNIDAVIQKPFTLVSRSLQSRHVLPWSLSSFLSLIESRVAYWTLARIPEGDDALLYQRWLGGVFSSSFRWFRSRIGASRWYKTLISIDLVCLCVRWALHLLSLALLLPISGHPSKTKFTSLCPCGRHFTRVESSAEIYMKEKCEGGQEKGDSRRFLLCSVTWGVLLEIRMKPFEYMWIQNTCSNGH